MFAQWSEAYFHSKAAGSGRRDRIWRLPDEHADGKGRPSPQVLAPPALAERQGAEWPAAYPMPSAVL
ncbi:hypothetical protein [Paenibacillus mucilaginosus]|uniref:hypothetical protein n=1 Tax=Paenibacillus mucilaginosus TaxID=61624 RepID=UPI003D1D1F30